MHYIYFDNCNFKFIKYQRDRMLYLYAAVSIAIATTALKFSQLGIDSTVVEYESTV